MRGGQRTLGFGLTGAAVLVVGVLPLFLVVLRAFTHPDTSFAALSTADTWRAAVNTLLVAGGAAVLAALVGTPLAWLVTRTDLPLRRHLRSVLPIPYIIPPYVAAIAWINLASPRVGLLNRVFGEGTFDVYGIGGLIWIMGLSLYPYVFLTVSAALENADPSLEDAARMSGAWTSAAHRPVTRVNGSANPLHSGGSRVAAPSDNMLPGARRSPRLKRGPQAFTCPGVRPPRRRG